MHRRLSKCFINLNQWKILNMIVSMETEANQLSTAINQSLQPEM